MHLPRERYSVEDRTEPLHREDLEAEFCADNGYEKQVVEKTSEGIEAGPADFAREDLV